MGQRRCSRAASSTRFASSRSSRGSSGPSAAAWRIPKSGWTTSGPSSVSRTCSSRRRAMWTAEHVVRVLRERGELWEAAPGLIGLRGDVLGLHRALGQAIARLAAAETDEEWLVPAGLGFETLVRAGYFQSFPQWLTAASHLSDEPGVLEWVATDADPAAAARRALAPADAALPPAVCYHVYARLAGRTRTGGRPEALTAQGTCWRHEGERLAPLGRGWAFTMREIVCVGSRDAVEAFRQRGIGRVTALAGALGLGGNVVPASDPFFAPTARGKALVQQL